MCDFIENIRGIIEPLFELYEAKGHAVVVHHQHFFNFPWVDDIMYESIWKVQPPHAQRVVHESGVILRECPGAY